MTATVAQSSKPAVHTPGPWRINGSLITAQGDLRSTVAIVPCKEDFRPCADAAAYTFAQRDANAKLIAASPELLNLLRDGAYQFDRLTGENLVAYARTFSALANVAISKAV